MPNWDKVRHKVTNKEAGYTLGAHKEHEYFVTGDSGKTNIHLYTYQKMVTKAKILAASGLIKPLKEPITYIVTL